MRHGGSRFNEKNTGSTRMLFIYKKKLQTKRHFNLIPLHHFERKKNTAKKKTSNDWHQRRKGMMIPMLTVVVVVVVE
jgi:hypothetical protein